jgi:hypothetical protein
MGVVTGRTPEARTVPSVGTTNASAAITGPSGSFNAPEDVGRTITGTGIPANTTITAVASSTAATMSANATATGTITATLGAGNSASYGFFGWSPETDLEADTYSVTAKNGGATSPDQMANTTTPITHRQRF